MQTAQSVVQGGDVVAFFPTYGHRHGGHWHIDIHGWVYEQRENSVVRRALLGLIMKFLKLDREQTEGRLFNERVRSFLVVNERGKRISISHGDVVFELPKSRASGHIEATISVPADMVESQQRRLAGSTGWFFYRAVTQHDDARAFFGKAQLLPETGVSVISDVDDTIKHTNVRERSELLANTFLREFRAVDGMADVYRRWGDAGAAFHYVSASPWQLHSHLSLFLEREGFPEGSMQLRLVRFKDPRALELLSPLYEAKSKAIRRILNTFPDRLFVMVGDSGENDLKLYGRLARTFSDQVRKIFIRRVDGAPVGEARLRRAFRGLPAHRWQLFDDPGALPEYPLSR